MRTPTWETSPGALAALLNSRVQLQIADLVTMELTNGTTLRYTSWGAPLTVNGQTFESSGSTVKAPGLQRGRVRSSIGVSVDSLDLTLVCDASTLYPGTSRTMQAVARDGLFLRAEVVLERVFSDGPDFAPVGTLAAFSGRIGRTQPSRSGVDFQVVSHMELLDTMVPAEVYQPGCRNTLYDLNCGVNRAANTHSITCQVASDPQRLTFEATLPTFGQPAAAVQRHFELGTITGVAGPLAGVRRTVKTTTLLGSGRTRLEVSPPWPEAVSVGQQFTITAGCNKKFETCRDKFANLPNFRGDPFVPVPETAL